METKNQQNNFNNPIVIILIVALIGLGSYILFSKNSDTNTSSRTENASTEQLPSITPVSAEEMQNSCQKIADAQLRNGLFESAAVNFTSGDTRPSEIKDVAHYNSTKSVCAFVTVVAEFPKVYSVTDPYETGGLNLYSVALLPDGSIQTPNNNGAVQLVAYSNFHSFTYPKPVDEIEYTDFNLKQIGIGTNNYSVQVLSVGNTISKTQFKALLSDYMETDSETLLNQIQNQ